MKKLTKIAIAGTLLLVFGISCAVGIIRHIIKTDVNKWCTTAQTAHPHPGDDLASLLEYVQSETHTLHERNYAIWAIGEFRDPRALSVLEQYFTGKDCNHSQNLCQHELEKAIRLCSKGALNRPSLVDE